MAIKRKDTKLTTIEEMPIYLGEMSLPQASKVLIEQISDPNIRLKDADERIIEIISAEYLSRYSNKIEKGLKAAQLKFPGADVADYKSDPERTLDEQIYFKLYDCEFIDQKRNVIVTGPCGCGKTWLICALGVKAVTQLRNVRFYNTSKLINILKIKEEKAYMRTLDNIAKLDLLILDDVGLMELDYRSCHIFFDILESRYENGSTIFISQYPVNEWYRVFENATFADASLSRAINKAYRLEIKGKDFRKTAS